MVSTISGPIPPHPYFDKSDPRTYLAIPAPRVRPEAQENAKNGHGTVCLALEIEGHRMPSAYTRTRKEPKNHFKENWRRLRLIENSSRQREEDGKQPVKALWKSSKYEGVESKVKEELEKGMVAPRPSSANYLRAHSRTGFMPQSARPASVEPPEEKLTVPKASTARESSLIRRDIDFIKVNGISAKKLAMRRSPSLTALEDLKKQQEDDEKTYRKGEVPKYLTERKKQWDKEEQEKRASQVDPDMPHGHRLMPDDERRATLEKIKQKEAELLQELSAMPIRNDTVRLRRMREELEQKLAKVEEAIKIFSRQKVYVKLDS